MNSITYKQESGKSLNCTVDRFFSKFRIYSLLKSANCSKEKGVPVTIVFKFIFNLIFSGKNLYRTMQLNKDATFGKDVVYRLMNSMYINWNKFIILLSTRVITYISQLTSNERINALILDDSIFKRDRSRNVELLTRVRDHSDGRYYCGFNLLSLGWSDGNTFLPFAFSLLSSVKKKTRVCEANTNIDKRSNGYKRREIAVMNKFKAALGLIDEAKKAKIPAKYILFDSWFSYPSFFLDIMERGYHTISMLKDMSRVFYRYKGRLRRLSSVYAIINTKRFSNTDPHIATVTVEFKDREDKWIPLKIAFIRENGNKREWIALASTDISLTSEEMVRIYSKRWDIEIFFKVCKSNLKLAKEFQSRSYDAIVAHTTIVFTRFLMLAYENRINSDDRSIGDLFFICCDELKDVEFAEAIIIILNIVKSYLIDRLILSEQAVQDAINFFFQSMPSIIKSKLLLINCES